MQAEAGRGMVPALWIAPANGASVSHNSRVGKGALSEGRDRHAERSWGAMLSQRVA